MNWDAAVGRKIERLGVGIVVRDHHGKPCVAKSLTYTRCLDPTTMEAMVAYIAVQLCTTLGLQWVQLEGDAHKVVDAVNKLDLNESH